MFRSSKGVEMVYTKAPLLKYLLIELNPQVSGIISHLTSIFNEDVPALELWASGFTWKPGYRVGSQHAMCRNGF